LLSFYFTSSSILIISCFIVYTFWYLFVSVPNSFSLFSFSFLHQHLNRLQLWQLWQLNCLIVLAALFAYSQAGLYGPAAITARRDTYGLAKVAIAGIAAAAAKHLADSNR